MEDIRVTVGDTYGGQAFEEVTTIEAHAGKTRSIYTIDGIEVEADVWAAQQKAAREREMEKTAGKE